MAGELVRLSILRSYGVRWSEETFARDLLQNFFDAAASFRDVSVEVSDQGGVVELRGQAEFDLDLLAYIGATTKGDGATAGGFGEGFKVCALVGTRDFGLRMFAGSGEQRFEVVYDESPLGPELCYRVERREGERGSFVRLEGGGPRCLAAFRASKEMFRHPDNPKLGAAVAVTEKGEAGLFESRLAEGEIYYRRQLRGQVRYWGGEPLTLVLDTPTEGLEGDRDRRDLKAYPVALAIGRALPPPEIHAALLRLVSHWKYGHEVLAALVDAAVERKLTFAFPAGWVARAHDDQGLTALAERRGMRAAVGKLAQVGMAVASDLIKGGLETTPPTPREQARIEAVVDLYKALNGRPTRIKEFEVFDLSRAAVRGQHLGNKIIVARQLLEGPFEPAAGTILHECSHEAGGEESSGFLRRLTRLLKASFVQRQAVAEARERFTRAEQAETQPRQGDEESEEEESEEESEEEERRKSLEEDPALTDRRGVWCTVLVPEAFPPVLEAWEELQAVQREIGQRLWVEVISCDNPEEAERFGACGLPSMHVSGEDVAKEPGQEPGFRARTYAGRLWPPRDKIKAAIEASVARGLVGDRSLDASFGAWKSPPKPPQPAWEEREDRLVKRASDHYCPGGYELEDLWSTALYLGALARIRARRRSKRGADELWGAIKAEVTGAIELSRELRRGEAEFEAADRFDSDCMGAAQGAAVLARLQRGGSEALAREVFREARSVFERSLSLLVAADMRAEVVRLSLSAAGLDTSAPEPRILPAALEAAFERLSGWALSLQASAEDEGRMASGHDLHMAEISSRVPRPESERERRRKRKEAERKERREEELRRGWGEAMASGATVEEALERHLARALELAGEEGP